MTDTRNTIMTAITKACTDLYYPEEVKPETKISELCRDSLDRVEFIMHIEERLADAGLDIVIDDDNAPGMEGTIGELVDFIAAAVSP